MRRLSALLPAILVVCPAAAARAQQADATAQVVVRVVEPDYAPLRGAMAFLDSASVLTDSAGTARFAAVRIGKRLLRVAAVGYALATREVRVEAGAPMTVEVRLERDPVRLPGVEVEGTAREAYLVRNGFYDRERGGGATFIAGARLRKVQNRSTQLVDALRGVSGVAVLPNGAGTGWALVSSRGEGSSDRCFPAVFIDGARVPYPSPAFADFNTVLPLADVGGIEVYAGAQNVPIEFGRYPCGTVLIWTRQGVRRK